MADSDDKVKGFSTTADVLRLFKSDEDKYISQEFQKYGYDLAKELEDMDHKALYIKLAKEEKRGLLEKAKNFVKDAKDVDHKGKLFMWKLSELKKAKNEKDKE